MYRRALKLVMENNALDRCVIVVRVAVEHNQRAVVHIATAEVVLYREPSTGQKFGLPVMMDICSKSVTQLGLGVHPHLSNPMLSTDFEHMPITTAGCSLSSTKTSWRAKMRLLVAQYLRRQTFMAVV